MTKENKEQVVEQPKQKTLQEATETELKAVAFDIQQQIKNLQAQYQQVFDELVKRQQK